MELLFRLRIHTRELKKVKFQYTGNDWHFVLFEGFGRHRLSVVDSAPQMVCDGQGNIMKPYSPTSFITLEIGVVWISQLRAYSTHE